MSNNLRELRCFLAWLERQKHYKIRIKYNDIDYLNLSKNQQRAAKATNYQPCYSYKEIINTIAQMPYKHLIQRRDKAIIALQTCCGSRVAELKTLKIKNIIAKDGQYFLDINPRDISVKFAKSRQVSFMNFKELLKLIIDWKNLLKSTYNFTKNDPLFPKMENN